MKSLIACSLSESKQKEYAVEKYRLAGPR
jgi:hypothetical protein